MKKGYFYICLAILSFMHKVVSLNNFAVGTCFAFMLTSIHNSASFAVKDAGKLISQKSVSYVSVLVHQTDYRLFTGTLQTSVTILLLMGMFCSCLWQSKNKLNCNFKDNTQILACQFLQCSHTKSHYSNSSPFLSALSPFFSDSPFNINNIFSLLKNFVLSTTTNLLAL